MGRLAGMRNEDDTPHFSFLWSVVFWNLYLGRTRKESLAFARRTQQISREAVILSTPSSSQFGHLWAVSSHGKSKSFVCMSVWLSYRLSFGYPCYDRLWRDEDSERRRRLLVIVLASKSHGVFWIMDRLERSDISYLHIGRDEAENDGGNFFRTMHLVHGFNDGMEGGWAGLSWGHTHPFCTVWCKGGPLDSDWPGWIPGFRSSRLFFLHILWKIEFFVFGVAKHLMNEGYIN